MSSFTNNPLSSGWIDIVDGTYTAASPLSIPANTATKVPNDAQGNTRVLEGPRDQGIDILDAMYDVDNQKIRGRTGDGLMISVEFQALPTSAGTTILETYFDIGLPGPVELYKRLISFPKGTGVVRPVNFTTGVYTLDTWERNGADLFVEANGTFDIYDIAS